MDSRNHIKEIYGKKQIALICAIIISIIGIAYLAYDSNSVATTADSQDVKKIYDGKKTALIYIEDSSPSNCKKCREVKKHLDSTKVKYVLYDKAVNGEKDYKKMLDVYGINIDNFKQPALLYIKEGNMYSNIINISNNDIIDQFLRDNKLI